MKLISIQKKTQIFDPYQTLSIPKPTKGIQGNAANSQGSTAELLGKCFKCLQLVPMLQKALSLYIDYSRKMADQSTKVYASVTADE